MVSLPLSTSCTPVSCRQVHELIYWNTSIKETGDLDPLVLETAPVQKVRSGSSASEKSWRRLVGLQMMSTTTLCCTSCLNVFKKNQQELRRKKIKLSPDILRTPS